MSCRVSVGFIGCRGGNETADYLGIVTLPWGLVVLFVLLGFLFLFVTFCRVSSYRGQVMGGRSQA